MSQSPGLACGEVAVDGPLRAELSRLIDVPSWRLATVEEVQLGLHS